MKKLLKQNTILTSVSILLLGACAAFEGNKIQKGKNAGPVVSNVQGVENAVGLDKVAQSLGCDRGIFVVDVVKDYVAGARAGSIIQIYGSGVVTNKQVKGFNPYAYLNYSPRDTSKKIDDSMLENISNAVSVEFGPEPVDSAAYSEGAVTNLQSARAMMGTTAKAATDGTSAVKPQTALFSHRSPADKTYHIAQGANGVSVTRPDDDVHAVRGKPEDGVADLKSFAITIKGHQFLATVPTDIESESGLDAGVSGQVGKPLKIAINQRPTPPVPVKSNFITVAIDDRSQTKPKWRSVYRVEDQGQAELLIPTEWTGGGMKDGTVGLELKRSYVYSFPFPDDKGGNICIEAGAGVRTTGSLAKKAEAKK